jgi:hypothetical protein
VEDSEAILRVAEEVVGLLHQHEIETKADIIELLVRNPDLPISMKLVRSAEDTG